MKTVELSAALGQAQVVENLKNFVGVDAQGAAALMTPERLAAVAGELDKRFAYFFSGIVEADQSGESTIQRIVQEVLNTLPDKYCSFSVLHHQWSYSNVVGFIYKGKQYGYFAVYGLENAPTYISLFDGKFKIVK